MKNLSLTTLTHTDARRQEFLVKCVKSVVVNTNLDSKVNWYVLINNYNSSWENTINRIQDLAAKSNFDIHFYKSEKNLGVGGGINYLNNLVKDYEFSVFIEGDWLCIPQELSKIDNNWLIDSIDYMNSNTEIDCIQLRRYLNDVDHRRFGFAHWIRTSNLEKIQTFKNKTYFYLKEREYTNPPTIRRHSRFFDIGLFPLDEWFNDDGNSLEVKGNPLWGEAEIRKESLGKQLNTVYLAFGNFVHLDDWPGPVEQEELKKFKIEGCNKYNGGCKYGFLISDEKFCKCCRFNKKFVDLDIHNHYYERVFLPFLNRQDRTEEEIDEFIRTTLADFNPT